MSLYNRIIGESASAETREAKQSRPNTPADYLPKLRSNAMNSAFGHLERNQGDLKSLQKNFHAETDPKRKALISLARNKLLKNISSKFQAVPE